VFDWFYSLEPANFSDILWVRLSRFQLKPAEVLDNMVDGRYVRTGSMGESCRPRRGERGQHGVQKELGSSFSG